MNELMTVQTDMARIAADLKSVQDRLDTILGHPNLEHSAKTPTLIYAKKYYRSRRSREEIFGRNDLFADPAWDILIDLFISFKEGKEVSVSSLWIAAAVPASTGLRWIKLLESEGMIERTADPLDARRFLISLSAATINKLELFFQGNL